MASRGPSLAMLRRRSSGAHEGIAAAKSQGRSSVDGGRVSSTCSSSISISYEQQHLISPPGSATSTASTTAFSAADDDNSDETLEGMFVGSRKGARHAPDSAPSSSTLAIAGFLFTMAFTAYIFPATIFFLIYRVVATGSLSACAALAFLVVHLIHPVAEGSPARPRVIELINRLMFRPWRRYFDFEIVSEAVLDREPSSAYILATHPHGIFPMGQWLSNPHLPMDVTTEEPTSTTAAEPQRTAQDIFPTTCVGGVATIMLHLPLFRYLFSAVAMVPVYKRKLLSLLRQGTSVVLIPGGIAEIYASDTEKEVLVLRGRKGFVRLALQTGSPIVPIYCLGNTNVFRLVSVSRKFTNISRACKVAATLFYGRWGLPVPFQTKLVTVVGTPIEVPPPSTWRRGVVEGGGDPAAAASLNSSRRRREEQEPPQELVDEVHARYVEELSALFHRHKWRIPGWEKRELVIT